HPAVLNGEIDTGYLDRHLDEFIGSTHAQADDTRLRAIAAVALRLQEASTPARQAASSPWAVADGWRLDGQGASPLRLQHGKADIRLAIAGHGGDYRVIEGETTTTFEGMRLEGGVLSGRIDGRAQRLEVRIQDARIRLHDGERRHLFTRLPLHRLEDEADSHADDRIRAPMPGRVVLVPSHPGQKVQAGDTVLVMEAMKMELVLKAPRDGVIAELRVKEGEFVEADAVLATLEA
ncbi:MAG: biotin/lipoyl-containing protein, partial [Pseudomonadota bacterium]|nr:biotin/lipoyl-containing protein [Pseudomonadota bacterium]